MQLEDNFEVNDRVYSSGCLKWPVASSAEPGPTETIY